MLRDPRYRGAGPSLTSVTARVALRPLPAAAVESALTFTRTPVNRDRQRSGVWSLRLRCFPPAGLTSHIPRDPLEEESGRVGLGEEYEYSFWRYL